MKKEEQTQVFDKFRPVTTKRASEEIYDQVRSLILSGEIKPNDRLPSERNMMEMFQRSRPTIREALRMLERSGYIRTIAGSNGAIVLEPNEKIMQQSMEDAFQFGQISLRDMSEYRKISEAASVTWAVERSEEADIQAMQAHLELMESCMGDYERFIDLDPEFHGLIASAAKNSVCVAMNETFSRLKQDYVKKKMTTMTKDEQRNMCLKIHQMHLDIFYAIEQRDIERAKSAMALHLSAFEEDLSDK